MAENLAAIPDFIRKRRKLARSILLLRDRELLLLPRAPHIACLKGPPNGKGELDIPYPEGGPARPN